MAFLKRSHRIQWTEGDRILLIKTVIQVEEENEEVMHKSNRPMQPSTHEKMAKWDRINYLLPQKLQGRSKGKSMLQSELSKYRCQVEFGSLLARYRAYLRGHRSGFILTRPVREMLKKREDRGNAAPSSVGPEESLKTSSGQGHVMSSTNTRSKNDLQQPKSPTSKSNFSLDHANKRSQMDLNNSRKNQNGVSSRSTEGADGHKNLANSTEPRLVNESKYREDLGEPSARRGVQTRAQTSRNAGSNSMAQTSFEECLQGVSVGPLRRLDKEFCHLSYWVENQLIPVGKKEFNERTISAMRSSKRRKLSIGPATKPFENLFHESLSRSVDLHIQTTFQNLRVQLTQLLNETAVEIAQVFIQDSPKL